MDIAKAIKFLYAPEFEGCVYISKELQPLLDKSGGDTSFVYAVCDTPSGDSLFFIEDDYAGEPIITRRIVHVDFYLKYKNRKIIEL